MFKNWTKKAVPFLAVWLLVGCSPAPELRNDRQAVEAEQKRAGERERLEKLEARIMTQETRIAQWQMASIVAGGVAIVALFIGIILGSRARDDAED